MTMLLQLNLSSSPSVNSPIGYHAIYFLKSTLSSSSSPSTNEPSMLQKTVKFAEKKWCEKESGVKVDIFIAMNVSGQ